MKKDEVLAAVYQTPTPAEEATTFATADEMTNLGLYAWLLICRQSGRAVSHDVASQAGAVRVGSWLRLGVFFG